MALRVGARHPRLSVRRPFEPFGEVAQRFVVGVMRDLVPDHHQDRQRPLEDLKGRE
jgi:hypothetical protein